jgi:hypothetical protein
LSILILEIFFKERYLVEIILIIIFHSIHVSKSQRGEKLNLLTGLSLYQFASAFAFVVVNMMFCFS